MNDSDTRPGQTVVPYSNKRIATMCREEAQGLREQMGELFVADLLDMTATALERSNRKRGQ